MTDIKELVKRLRLQPARYERDVFWSDGAPHDAADALEAQAKRIAELDGVIKSGIEHLKATDDLVAEYRARIAELEALLKPFEEKFSKSLADAEKLAANEGYALPAPR